MKTVLGYGVYNLTEAARLTRLNPQRAREWFTGRSDGRKPIFQSDYQIVDGDRAISFLDLIELFVAGQLRVHGVSLQTLRKVHKRLENDLGTRHPFCRREMLSDGRSVFILGLDDQGGKEMIDILSRQRVFVSVLEPFLKRIDYDGATLMARKWSIADKILIDPTICLGKPIVEEIGMRTAILANAYEANGRDAEVVADWYGVLPSHVMAAVEFEKNLVA